MANLDLAVMRLIDKYRKTNTIFPRRFLTIHSPKTDFTPKLLLFYFVVTIVVASPISSATSEIVCDIEDLTGSLTTESVEDLIKRIKKWKEWRRSAAPQQLQWTWEQHRADGYDCKEPPESRLLQKTDFSVLKNATKEEHEKVAKLFREDHGLSGACLRKSCFVNLENASFLRGANFAGANFWKSDLRNADFGSGYGKEQKAPTRLSRAIFGNANLRGTDFEGANLVGAEMVGSQIDDKTYLGGAKVSSLYYDPRPADAVPSLRNIYKTVGMDKLHWQVTPLPMVKLAKQLRESRLTAQARNVEYAIKIAELSHNPDSTERFFQKLFFVWTGAWGKSWYFPLMYLFSGWLVLACVVRAVFHCRGERSGYIHEITIEEDGTEKRTEISNQFRKLILFSIYNSVDINIPKIEFQTYAQKLDIRQRNYDKSGFYRFLSGVHTIYSLYFVSIFLIVYVGGNIFG